jgi:N-acetylmuramoyl-L-alanine amidase
VIVKLNWLLSSVLAVSSAFIIATPAFAGRLETWRFDNTENRLVFTTDSGVQPRAQLIANPVRVVIDLPNTTVDSALLNQAVGGAIREVRVGQFDAQTTRIVIELSPGYTVDPNAIVVQGITSTQWSVQLPTPQLVDTSETVTTQSPSLLAGGSNDTPVSGAATQIQSIRVTPDGFFIGTAGATPEVELERDEDEGTVTVRLPNTIISPQISQRELTINQYGVERLSLVQSSTNPPETQIILTLEDENANWQASASGLGGVVLIPLGGTASGTAPGSALLAGGDNAPEEESPAIISAITLPDDSRQLLIESDRPITVSSNGWDRTTLDYQITIDNAQLADQVTGPQLGDDSPIQRIRLLQQDEDTVVIYVQPVSGVLFSGVSQVSPQSLGLNIQLPSQPGTGQYPTVNFPDIPDGEIVVVLDPGHGGPDPGAIGRGGLQETGVVLDIAERVQGYLEDQGVYAVLTRTGEYDLGLEPRVEMAESLDADLFVSIHANAISLSRPDVNGLETYYYSDAGLGLARVVHESVLDGTGMIDRGVRQARFYVIVHTTMPAILVETGFVTGDIDAANLSDADWRDQMAASIASGILQYIQQNF